MDNLPSTSESALQNEKTCAHCVSTLAVAFVNAHGKTPAPRFLECGVSKTTCWLSWGSFATLLLSFPYMRVLVTSCHGKIDTWLDTPSRNVSRGGKCHEERGAG